MPNGQFTDGCRFMFGDSLPNAIEHIELQALRDGTAEAFMEAYHKINGIGTLITFMNMGHDRMRLNGALERMRLMSESPSLRNSVLRQLTAGKVATRPFGLGRIVRPDYWAKAEGRES